MSTGELAFLGLAIGCFAIFAVAVIWLRADYVKLRERGTSSVDRLRVQTAE